MIYRPTSYTGTLTDSAYAYDGSLNSYASTGALKGGTVTFSNFPSVDLTSFDHVRIVVFLEYSGFVDDTVEIYYDTNTASHSPIRDVAVPIDSSTNEFCYAISGSFQNNLSELVITIQGNQVKGGDDSDIKIRDIRAEVFKNYIMANNQVVSGGGLSYPTRAYDDYQGSINTYSNWSFKNASYTSTISFPAQVVDYTNINLYLLIYNYINGVNADTKIIARNKLSGLEQELIGISDAMLNFYLLDVILDPNLKIYNLENLEIIYTMTMTNGVSYSYIRTYDVLVEYILPLFVSGSAAIQSQSNLTTIGFYKPPIYGQASIQNQSLVNFTGEMIGVYLGKSSIQSQSIVNFTGDYISPKYGTVIIQSQSIVNFTGFNKKASIVNQASFKVYQSIEFRIYKRFVLQNRIISKSIVSFTLTEDTRALYLAAPKIISLSQLTVTNKIYKAYFAQSYLQSINLLNCRGIVRANTGKASFVTQSILIFKGFTWSEISEQLNYMEEHMEDIEVPPVYITGDFLLPEDIEPLIKKDSKCLLQTQ